MLTIKHTRLTASPGFRKSLNRTFPGPIIMELAGIAIGVHTATLLAMNTAMTTALGSAPIPWAMERQIGTISAVVAVLDMKFVMIQQRRNTTSVKMYGDGFSPNAPITLPAINSPAPVL